MIQEKQEGIRREYLYLKILKFFLSFPVLTRSDIILAYI